MKLHMELCDPCVCVCAKTYINKYHIMQFINHQAGLPLTPVYSILT